MVSTVLQVLSHIPKGTGCPSRLLGLGRSMDKVGIYGYLSGSLIELALAEGKYFIQILLESALPYSLICLSQLFWKAQ